MYDIEDIIADSNALFHVDAVQAIGHLDIDFHDFKIDTMSITGHKFGGPKGAGILLVKENTPIEFNQLGGEQETKRRAGTENVPQIVGLTKAFRISRSESRCEQRSFDESKRIILSESTRTCHSI